MTWVAGIWKAHSARKTPVLNLERAISLDKSFVKKARNDPDFSVIQKNADFLSRVNPKWHNPMDHWKPIDLAVPEREWKIRKSRAVILDDRRVAFFRSAERAVHAIELINKELDAGKSLDEIFYTGDDCGYEIDVSKSEDPNFVSGFSCTVRSAEELLGDGGEWRVSFRENEIQELERLGFGMTWNWNFSEPQGNFLKVFLDSAVFCPAESPFFRRFFYLQPYLKVRFKVALASIQT